MRVIDFATEIVNCLRNGIEAHVAGVEFDVCVPCDKEEVAEVLSYVDGRCVYLVERNLALCPMGNVLYSGCFSKKNRAALFYNSVACGSCVCKCVPGRRSFSIVMREEEFSKVYGGVDLYVGQFKV